MSRRDNARFRCPGCRMLGGLCVCELLPAPRIETATRVVVVIHRDEDRKPTNTGRLAAACLANSEVWVRGEIDQPELEFRAAPGSRPLLLFPSDDARPLDAIARSSDPVALIVPDGTWRQARRVRHRVPGLRDVPCVALPPGGPSRYQLRHEPRSGGLATIEAIARALEILEDSAVRHALEQVFRVVVDRTLWSRGVIDAAAVTGGIPDGIERHAPWRRRPELRNATAAPLNLQSPARSDRRRLKP